MVPSFVRLKFAKFLRLAGLSFVICLLIGSFLFVPQAFGKAHHAYAAGSAGQTTSTPKYMTEGQKIIDTSTHQRYIPYGVFIGGIYLANTNWQTNGATTYVTQDAVQAAHDFWYANMISLQLAYEPLYPNGPDQPVDAQYVALIDNVVNWAGALNMNVNLVLQEESIYGIAGKTVYLPTTDALTFWNYMSKHYANNPRVFFDLYNEPNVTPAGKPALLEPSPSSNDINSCPNGTPTVAIGWDEACAWSYWKNGTTQGGVTYVGMNQLAEAIRKNGANNLIFAQGLASGEDLAELDNGYTSGGGGKEFLLTTRNAVYEVHPYFGGSHDTQSGWDTWFGNSATKGHFPVIAGEWTLDQESASGCEAGSTTEIAQISVFFRYLWQKNIGLIGWALQNGTLIRNGNFRDPTAFSSSTMPACNAAPFSVDPNAQGVGQLLRTYFATRSVQE